MQLKWKFCCANASAISTSLTSFFSSIFILVPSLSVLVFVLRFTIVREGGGEFLRVWAVRMCFISIIHFLSVRGSMGIAEPRLVRSSSFLDLLDLVRD